MGDSTVDQTPKGWIRHYRGKKELICNKSWRIKHIIEAPRTSTPDANPPRPKYAVEIFEDSKWVLIECDRLELDTKTFPTLTKACVDNNLSTLTSPPKWHTSLLHIAMQLNPSGQPTRQFTCGLDLNAACVRTNAYDVSILDGQLSRPATRPSLDFLPLADGSLPSPSAVTAMLNSKPTHRTLSAALLQLLARCQGNRQVSVSTSRLSAPATLHLLTQAGLTGSNAPPELATRSLTHDGKLPPRRSLLETESSWWVAGGVSIANWMAAYKPTIYLGRVQTDLTATPILTAQQLQRAVLLLLSGSLAHIGQGMPIRQALSTAWTDLATRVGLSSARKPNPLPTPITVSQAAGFWISRAVTAQDIKVAGINPRKFDDRMLWPDRNPDYFWVARAAINEAIAARRLPPWCVSSILANTTFDAGFRNQGKHKGTVAWRLSRDVLTTEVQQLLYASKKPLRNPKTA